MRSPHSPGAILQPAFFRTYVQVRDELRQIEREHPDLIRIEDIGDSSEKVRGTADRDILAVHLTSPVGRAGADGARAGSAPHVKPTAVWIAGVHPTETANPELMMQFIRTMVDGYGRDADITGILDSREIAIIPMANPDGHGVVERGYATGDRGDMGKRKNTSPPFGVDLNRNWDHHWAAGAKGSSSNPRSGKYHGPSAFSEPETRAISSFIRRMGPGEFIDWHSPGRDVLYPWGDTKAPPPDDAGFRAFAGRLAAIAGYEVEQASSYSTSQGTSDDWVYGELGIPAVTVESGTTSRQHDDEFRRDWRELEPVMRFAAKVADDPFGHSAGPDATDVRVTSRQHTVTARLGVDPRSTATRVERAEAFIDPSTPAGGGVPMHARDGRADSAIERMVLPVESLGEAAVGASLVYVRAQDSAGVWGPATAAWLAPRA